MAQYILPYFGELNTENLEMYYSVDIVLKGQEIQVDLNFESGTIDTKQLDAIKHFLDNILDFDKRNKKYIEDDYADESCDTVRTYVEHHLDEIEQDELTEIIDFDSEILSLENQLINALKLVRVGLYPDSEDQFAVFDYSIGRDLTQYLVVINTDKDGNLDYIAMES